MGERKPAGGWRRGLTVLPAVTASLLPGVTWPCMVPALAGLVGSTGLAFCLHTAYLLPLTVVTLLAAVGALGFRARRRRGYGPLAVGLVAAAFVVIGKFALGWTWLAYAGVAVLVAASAWNSWPVKAAADSVQLGVPRGDSRGQLETVDNTTEA